MKKLAVVLLLVMLVLNVAILFTKADTNSETGKEECSLMKRPKIELTEVNPGILPNLLKS